MITLTNEELQYLEIDSFLPKMFNSFHFSGKSLMGYEMILNVKSPLSERLTEEYHNNSGEPPVMMKMLNTQFIIKSLETTPTRKLIVETTGKADSLHDLVAAGLKINTSAESRDPSF
ncbi:hypothetical protein Psch_04131 [Pelotomaculum schinkii]|uniref:Uncharacterized protein n=1 Tax=Pelotomaculum schinkii TaxID=78350 RepID=A0A4Y7R616_9FIRM|nr:MULTISPECIES: hypothetical protein [Pelotomaculum]TEB04404.1 hypothetical protein Psch_04131 [Pelotomaculum schinkii]TEB15251.1 hypothetical protein Psfp_02288 [Pelotomaculum sp. FP]